MNKNCVSVPHATGLGHNELAERSLPSIKVEVELDVGLQVFRRDKTLDFIDELFGARSAVGHLVKHLVDDVLELLRVPHVGYSFLLPFSDSVQEGPVAFVGALEEGGALGAELVYDVT